ncbi:MAG TPA: carbamoyltransferase HypF [Acidimicrobiales bacterium]|nr:carbamoyltransferase HypF [Acidimicrobiales bacterium]
MSERRRIRVTGTVQGVGFRPFVYRTAVELGLSGTVANDSAGVIVEAEGTSELLDELSRRISDDAPPLARVESVQETKLAATGADRGFRIVESHAAGAPAVAVSVDVATCTDCLSELHDPQDRRFGYPFVNCTNCGPRYTIITAIPYDRSSTTMARFTMCAACRSEYEDPADRRFHAEPNACPECGPHLRLLDPAGSVVAERGDALRAAADHLMAGRILGVKGLGGYHLAVDATSVAGVAELRRRKARDDKPFAVMVADVESARVLCRLSPAAEATLTSPRRPIVLAPRRESLPSGAAVGPHLQVTGGDGGPLSEAVAPRLPELGLMLPYTPLHDLLLARVGRPLVMTSGNLSDEPIAHNDADAVARLGPMVDFLLTHDRDIHIRCDDSVVRAGFGGRVQMVRRSRGYSPEPLTLPVPTSRHVLAVGAELKSTVAVAKGAHVVASHHIGDLEHLSAYQSFLQAIDHLCHIAGVSPELVVHDLHPEYLSTKFAIDLDLPNLAVQHHHAHIASCLAEHGHSGPVLGIAFDGLGMGTDGTLWGGEFLVADLQGFRRVGHLRPVPLPGGNRAIREPWRMGMVWVNEALGSAEAERFGAAVDERWSAVLGLADLTQTPLTSSAGRLFDAVGALLGLRQQVTYEAQAAIELEACAAGVTLDAVADCAGGAGLDALAACASAVELETAGAYPSDVSRDNGLLVLDPSPLIARVVDERDAGTATPLVSAGFHAGLGLATAGMAATLARAEGLDTVALSGGVFQNSRLTEIVVGHLRPQGMTVLVHERVPPNDGGISIGQAAIAAASPRG